MPAKPFSVSQAVNNALDKAYLESALPMLNQIGKLSNSVELQNALRELETEAERLLAEQRRMAPDNPVLIKSLLVYGTLLIAVQALINANSGDIEDTGIVLAAPAITAKVFSILSGQRTDPVSIAALSGYQTQLARMGINWSADAGALAIRYTRTTEWIARMEGWGQGYVDLARNAIVQGIQGGWGPRQVALTMRHHAQNIPLWAAENMTRTLQLTSYRDAVLALEIENSHLLLGKFRIARLDDKTCAACVALHGSRLEIGQRLEDHYRGRCTEAYSLPGREIPEQMVADGRVVEFQSGEEWFSSISSDRQAQQSFMSSTPAMLNAYRSGVPLSDFVGHHEDSVFGGQVIQQSLIQALGERATEFYVR